MTENPSPDMRNTERETKPDSTENGEPIYGKVARTLDEVLLDSYDLPLGRS